MENINTCRTAVGIAVQAAKLLNRPHEYQKYTTLNEYFDILPEAHQELTTHPNVGYFCLGLGAHRMVVNDNNIPLADPIPHETTNTGLYKPVPFVLRQINNDLTAEQRKKYALRRKETHNGLEYWAYYLKRLPSVTDSAEVIHDYTKDGITTSRPFNFTAEDLYPVPPELPNEGVVVSSADIIRISAKVVIDFTAQDVEEYVAACQVIYGDKRYAIISEIGIVSGTDKQISSDGEKNQSIYINECVGAQIVTFVSTHIPVHYNNQGFYHEFELGEGEPLLTKGEIRTTRYSVDVKPSATSPTLAGTIYDASNPLNGVGTSTTATIGARTSNTGTPTGVAAGTNTSQPGVRSDD